MAPLYCFLARGSWHRFITRENPLLHSFIGTYWSLENYDYVIARFKGSAVKLVLRSGILFREQAASFVLTWSLETTATTLQKENHCNGMRKKAGVVMVV